MMLLHPSPGQLSDRLTILSLKIEKCSGYLKDQVKAALEEHLACERVLRIKYLAPSDLKTVFAFGRLFTLLQEQNRKQWDYEDMVRAAIKACSDPPDYGQLMQVYRAEKPNAEGNEIRASLVRQIDSLFKIVPEVKIYA